MDRFQIVREIELAHNRIKKYIVKTPLLEFEGEAKSSDKIFLKLENAQHTGSFKLRGALNKILSLSSDELSLGIIAASTGNHALATAYALKLTNRKGTIFLPNEVVETKLAKLSKFDVDLIHYGDDSSETEIEARKISIERNKPFISPYNDYQVIAGQGTIGLEIYNEFKTVENVFVTVGGGGMISGIACYLKHVNPNIKVYGCQPENSAVMYHSIKKGRIIQMESKTTISDGSAGGIESNSITFELVQNNVDKFILVTEDEIKKSMKELFGKTKLIVEGAAAVAMAAYNKISENLSGDSVIVICGGNIDTGLFNSIVG
ncbi:MAG: L-threonine dehydratase catabolic TdcB [Candidatus Heimdallarchaeota archaeon LC_2]|nr:MAG: L-threonine dehydratase catabolic TdcB [Candidatus Heimdallarchaeota archaeon LC_2]